nr:T9SS type A sorting domain-containing protein [Flavobacterium piscinae]
MALQSDGKIILGGNFTALNGEPQNYCVRLNSDGTKDNSFSVETGFNDRITCLNIQDDGKIMVGGNFTSFNGELQKHLIRLNSDGTKDESFNIGTGFISVNNNDVVRDLEILPNGSLYITAFSGFYNGNLVRMPIRLLPDGTLDTTFMSAANISGSATIDALAVQQNGKVIVGGTFLGINGINPNQRRVMRLHPDGTFDETFDVSGGNPNYYGGFDTGVCSEIIMQADGKIWLAGSFFAYQSISSFSAIRLEGDAILPVDEFELPNNDIQAYPNPVKNRLYLNKNFNYIEVYDFTGKRIEKLENTNSIDFSKFSNGTYILTLQKENSTIETKKIIKQ